MSPAKLTKSVVVERLSPEIRLLFLQMRNRTETENSLRSSLEGNKRIPHGNLIWLKNTITLDKIY